MTNLQTSGFAPLSTEELQDLNGGGLITGGLGTVEGVVNTVIFAGELALNAIGGALDGLTGSLPLGSITGLLGGLLGGGLLGGIGGSITGTITI